MNIKIPYQRSAHLRNTIHADSSDPDKFTVQTTEDVSAIVDFCQQKQWDTRLDKRDGMFHVAEVPVSVYEQAVHEGWDNPEGWKRWLNDPDNAIFRTWKGRV